MRPARATGNWSLDHWAIRVRSARLLAFGGSGGSAFAPETVRRIHGILRRALNQGVKWGWIGIDPAAATTSRVPVSDIKPLESADLARVLRRAALIQVILRSPQSHHGSLRKSAKNLLSTVKEFLSARGEIIIATDTPELGRKGINDELIDALSANSCANPTLPKRSRACSPQSTTTQHSPRYHSVAGTVCWTNGIDPDPDVLHGDHTSASAIQPRLIREYRMRQTS